LRIGGVVDMSTVDWYGNVSIVVFFAGCNFLCPYCHNSSLIPLDSGEIVELEYLRARILMNMSPVPELDSVVLTGGEPTLQVDSVIEICRLAKSLGLKTMLDTNGSLPDAIESVLKTGLLDRVALDIKAPLKQNAYKYFVGSHIVADTAVTGVRDTLNLCQEYGVEVEARTTVVPTLSDSEGFIAEIAKDIAGNCSVYYLQQFDNTGDVLNAQFKTLRPPAKRKLTKLAEVALGEGVNNVYIKTRALGLERIG
jgi:pyruvate formate lyase activating enzyme